MLRPPAWHRQAACADHPEPDLWFSDNDPRALAVCGDCPVRKPCGDYATKHQIDHGIWGGLTETDRRPRGRKRTLIDHGTERGYIAHRRRGDLPACQLCRDAHAEYVRDRTQRRAANQ